MNRFWQAIVRDLQNSPWPCLVSVLVVGTVALLLPLNNDFVGAFGFAIAMAQLPLLAIYLCLAPGEFWGRLLLTLGTALWLGSVHLAVALNSSGFDASKELSPIFDLYGIFLLAGGAAQLPLWPLRLWGGWRIGREALPQDRPLAIRDLMVGTFLCALLLAVPTWRTPPQPKAWDLYWAVVMGFTIAAATSTLVVLPPTLWSLLRVKRRPFVVVGALVTPAISLVVLIALRWANGRPLLEGDTAALFFGYFLALYLPLVVCRWLNLRLLTRWNRPVVVSDQVASGD